MKIGFNLKLAIAVVAVFAFLIVGLFLYEPLWFIVQERRIKSDDAAIRAAAIKAVAAKGEKALPHVTTWLKSSNDNLAIGACRIVVEIKKYFDDPVKHIVRCPQRNGLPIFAVFEEGRHDPKGKAKGHIELIDHTGETFRYYRGANVIEGAFEDVNNDGIIDNVEVIPSGLPDSRVYGDILHVLPITRAKKPLLRVAYNNSKDDIEEWSWELVETGTPGIFDISVGPVVDEKTAKVKPEAVYRWSVSGRKYEGPKGGIGQPFIRLDGEHPGLFEDYLKGISQENRKKPDGKRK
ncbi:MAG: hypothetical protein E3J72_04180 [Planctomycetota bacterium]|nr:MAG: hypothetical protein E3J72_04180 [Planctomycetota bacterium]